MYPTANDAPQKPVALLLPTGGVCEFGDLENAQKYLTGALHAGAPGVDQAALFSFNFARNEWQRIV